MKTELNQTEMQIIQMIREEGQQSRSELAQTLGYSRASMTGFVNRLMELKILTQVGEGQSQGGRRPLILDINGDFGYIVGYDIGATSIDIAVANFRGDILANDCEPANVTEDAEIVLGRCADIALGLLKQIGGKADKVIGVGVGVPGPVEFARGVLIAPPLMPSWENFSIRSFVNQTFSNAEVIVDNDVNIMALGEQRAGAAIGTENFIWVKIGTGIGSGIIADSKLYRGAGGAAGNIGHIEADPNGPTCLCGQPGCIEVMVAGPAIAYRGQLAAEQGNSPFLADRIAKKGSLTSIDVGEAAANGDTASIEIIKNSGWLLGKVLASLVEFFNPEVIYIGGGVSNIGFHFLSSVRQAVLQRANPLSTRDLRIEYTQLGNIAGVTGAIWLTFPYLFKVDERKSS